MATNGNDWLVGDDSGNTIYGLGGDDNIWGYGGNDWLVGGSGNDIVVGGDGGDSLWGEAGDDWLYGEFGDDVLVGEDGNDGLVAGAGDDWLYGGTGNDYMLGDAGRDFLVGEAGDDYMNTGAGIDVMIGGAGGDTFFVDTDFAVLLQAYPLGSRQASAIGHDWVDRVTDFQDGIDRLYFPGGSWGVGDGKILAIPSASGGNLIVRQFGEAWYSQLHGFSVVNYQVLMALDGQQVITSEDFLF